MDRNRLSDAERQNRTNIRNHLLIATLSELVRERKVARSLGNAFYVECVDELIGEMAEAGQLEERR